MWAWTTDRFKGRSPVVRHHSAKSFKAFRYMPRVCSFAKVATTSPDRLSNALVCNKFPWSLQHYGIIGIIKGEEKAILPVKAKCKRGRHATPLSAQK